MTGTLSRFDHLRRLSDSTGLFEHARFTTPRPEHAYCVDDVARGLLVTVRQPVRPPELVELSATYQRFVVDAQSADGRFHNRRGLDRRWEDEPSLEDCWGRALWGLGSAVARAPELAAEALGAFTRGAVHRSVWARAMAFAALGAAEVLSVFPDHRIARSLLADAVTVIGRPEGDPRWRWPELRLRYANAALAEALIAAGSLLGDEQATRDGLAMLKWLLQVETNGRHLSMVPVGGWCCGEPRPGFDQQPIEVAALADACARAFDVTGDDRWAAAIRQCADWFLGANDVGIALFDPVSRGGCDGLHAHGRNENQGAESTLAMISTFQQADRILARSTTAVG